MEQKILTALTQGTSIFEKLSASSEKFPSSFRKPFKNCKNFQEFIYLLNEKDRGKVLTWISTKITDVTSIAIYVVLLLSEDFQRDLYEHCIYKHYKNLDENQKTFFLHKISQKYDWNFLFRLLSEQTLPFSIFYFLNKKPVKPVKEIPCYNNARQQRRLDQAAKIARIAHEYQKKEDPNVNGNSTRPRTVCEIPLAMSRISNVQSTIRV